MKFLSDLYQFGAKKLNLPLNLPVISKKIDQLQLWKERQEKQKKSWLENMKKYFLQIKSKKETKS